MATATTFNDVRQMLRRWDKVRKLPRSRKHLEVLKITIIFFSVGVEKHTEQYASRLHPSV